MQVYAKIQRKIISHPKNALDEVRKLLDRHTRRKNTCLKCSCIWGQHIHHTGKYWVQYYRCSHCNKTYSEFLGTIFFRSKLKPTEWLTAILELSTATGGLSGAELGRKIDRQRKTGWRLLKSIRTSLLEKNSGKWLLFSGETEADEAWFLVDFAEQGESKPQRYRLMKTNGKIDIPPRFHILDAITILSRNHAKSHSHSHIHPVRMFDRIWKYPNSRSL